jgi:hypothetical protein
MAKSLVCRGSVVFARRWLLGLLMLAAGMAGGVLNAQGAFNLSSVPAVAPGNSNAGISFDVIAGPSDLTIYRVGTMISPAATDEIEVWYRPGGISTVYPMTAAANAATSGWTMAGFASTVFAAADTITQVPLTLNLNVAANQKLGFALVRRNGSQRYANTPATPNPFTVTDPRMTISVTGVGGARNTAPAAGAAGMTFTNYPRGWCGTVWYDLAQVAGDSLEVQSAVVGSGLPGIGNNTITAMLRNNGSTTLTSVNVNAEYSTDGGTTWVGSIPATSASLAATATIPVTFTLPWNITTVGVKTLSVRYTTAIGAGPAVKSYTYTPDADLTTAFTSPSANPLVAPNTVSFTLKNNGTLNLNGVPISVRYTVDAGTNYVTQVFTPTTLPASDATQSFSFTQPWTLAAAAAATLTVSIFPAMTGDPDATDSITQSYPSAGQLVLVYDFNGPLSPGPSGGANTFPFGQPICKKQVHWSPAQLGGNAGVITEFGVMFSAAFTNVTWPSVRVEMGESTLGAALTTTFDANYNVPSRPKTVVYNGPLTLTCPAANALVRWPLTTTFDYSGQNHLLVTIFVNGASSTTGVGYLVSQAVATNSRLYASALGDSATGTVGASWALGASFKFQLGVSGSSLQVVDIGPDGVTSVASVGSHFVKASIKNTGTVNFTGTPVPLQYSVDGGTTWTSQTFTPTALYSLYTETFSFTAPWVIAAVGAADLRVRINPAIGATQQERQETYVPDLDVTAVATVPVVPVVGNNVITATVKNNGTFDLGTQPVPMRYTVNSGATFVSQTFTPTTLGTPGNSQTFTFTAPWVTNPGNYMVTADISTPPAGDPDAVNAFTATYAAIGYSGAELITTMPEVGTQTQAGPGSGYPLNSWWMNIRNDPIYLATELTTAGLSAGSAIVQVQMRVSQLPGQELKNIRIRMQHSALSAPAAAFVTTGWTQHYGPTTIPVASLTVDQWFSFPLSPAFVWDGTSNVILDFTMDDMQYTGNGGVYLRQFTTPRAHMGYDDDSPTNPALPAFPFDTIANQMDVNFVPSLKVFHGPAMLVNDMNLESTYIRVSGAKDVYRGQTVNLAVSISNPRSFSIEMQTLSLSAVDPNGVPISGVSFTMPTFPILLTANASQVLNIPMIVAANAGGTNGIHVSLVATGTAVDPTNVVNNPVVVGILDNAEAYDLYDGPAPAPFTITQTSLSAATGSVLYFQTLSAGGGSGTYTWSVSSTSPATLPTSLALTANGSTAAPAFITGTPLTTDAGTRQIKFECTDGSYVTTKTLTLLIQSQPLGFVPIVSGLPNAMEGSLYGYTFVGVGGSGSYAFSVASSGAPLPTGMSLNANGTLSGVPAPLTQGFHNIVFRVNDGFSTADLPLTLTVDPGPLLWVGPPTMSGKETVAFTGHLSAAGGVAVRNYSVAPTTANQLPPGLSRGVITGDITGTPALNSGGAYNVTFNVTDGVTTLPHVVTINIGPADPFLITTPSIPAGEATQPYSATFAAIGGAEVYAWTIQSSVPALPAGLSLASGTGVLSGTAGFDAHGRYALVVKCTDTANRTLTANYTLVVTQRDADTVQITELDVGTSDYIEISHRGGDAVDLSGWSIGVWVDSTSPLALGWSTFPVGTFAFSGTAIQINGGGTAGGSFPTFATGTAFNATSASNVAVVLYDAHMNVIDVVATGNVVVGSLDNAAAANAGITTSHWATNLATGSNNYSRSAAADTNTGADWTVAATGTPGVFNTALPVPALEIAVDRYPAAKVGVAYGRTIVAVGGVPPYAYSLVNATSNLIVLGAAESAAHSFTFSSPSLSSQANTVASVDLTLGGTATAVADFEVRFTMANPELVFTGVTKGPALSAAGASVLVWKRGDTYLVAGFYAGSSTASAMAPGKVATLNFKVVPAGTATKATDGVTAMPVSEAVASDTQDTALSASGTAGSITLNGYKNQDVNHNNTVNVQDVQLCVNLILHTATPTYTGQGDVNKSGSVTVADVQSIVNCILNAAACTQ